jgi:hypothetical protein
MQEQEEEKKQQAEAAVEIRKAIDFRADRKGSAGESTYLTSVQRERVRRQRMSLASGGRKMSTDASLPSLVAADRKGSIAEEAEEDDDDDDRLAGTSASQALELASQYVPRTQQDKVRRSLSQVTLPSDTTRRRNSFVGALVEGEAPAPVREAVPLTNADVVLAEQRRRSAAHDSHAHRGYCQQLISSFMNANSDEFISYQEVSQVCTEPDVPAVGHITQCPRSSLRHTRHNQVLSDHRDNMVAIERSLQDMVKAMDANGDGLITVEEFRQCMGSDTQTAKFFSTILRGR